MGGSQLPSTQTLITPSHLSFHTEITQLVPQSLPLYQQAFSTPGTPILTKSMPVPGLGPGYGYITKEVVVQYTLTLLTLTLHWETSQEQG